MVRRKITFCGSYRLAVETFNEDCKLHKYINKQLEAIRKRHNGYVPTTLVLKIVAKQRYAWQWVGTGKQKYHVRFDQYTLNCFDKKDDWVQTIINDKFYDYE